MNVDHPIGFVFYCCIVGQLDTYLMHLLLVTEESDSNSVVIGSAVGASVLIIISVGIGVLVFIYRYNTFNIPDLSINLGGSI